MGSLVAVPLVAGDRTGALVAVRRTADAFEADDVAALETFAGQAALALSHAALFADALDAARLSRELALAREVQKRLFPQSLPVVDGLDLAAAEQSAREVGGDYYDAVRLGDACVGLLVADVSGKGAAAAFYMAEMKGVVQAASRLTRAPGELLSQANDALASSLARGAFVSAAYAVVDAEAGTVAVGRAGHCPPVLARDPARADGGRWLLRPAGLAIGLDRAGTAFRRVLREQTVHLAPGDVLVLYTDGLVEARNPDGEEYGYERLADAVAEHRHRPAEAIKAALLDSLLAWTDGADPADDLSLVVMRWTGRAAVPVPPPGAVPPVTDRPAFP
jgi:serine phosphatase RsbU (regulator of sigma subunit)